MIYKRCSRCGRRLPSGTACDCVQRRHAEYDKLGRDKNAAAFYHSGAWKTIRQIVLDKYDSVDIYLLCTTGEIVTADIVHHIDELSDEPTLGLAIDNLVPVSSATHNTIHAAYKQSPATKHAMQERLRECLRRAPALL